MSENRIVEVIFIRLHLMAKEFSKTTENKKGLKTEKPST